MLLCLYSLLAVIEYIPYHIYALTDGLGWVFECRVVFIDFDLRNNGGNFFILPFFYKSIRDGLSQPITDLALRHGHSGFERHGGSFF